MLRSASSKIRLLEAGRRILDLWARMMVVVMPAAMSTTASLSPDGRDADEHDQRDINAELAISPIAVVVEFMKPTPNPALARADAI